MNCAVKLKSPRHKYARHEIIDENQELRMLSNVVKLALEPSIKGWQVDSEDSRLQRKKDPITKNPVYRGITRNKSYCATTFKQIYEYYECGYGNNPIYIDDNHEIRYEKLYMPDKYSSVAKDRDWQYMNARFYISSKKIHNVTYRVCVLLQYSISKSHPFYKQPPKRCTRVTFHKCRVCYQRLDAKPNEFVYVYLLYYCHVGGWVTKWISDTALSSSLWWKNEVKSYLDGFHSKDMQNAFQRGNKGFKTKKKSILINNTYVNNNNEKDTHNNEELEWLNVYQSLLAMGFQDNESLEIAKKYPLDIDKAIEALTCNETKVTDFITPGNNDKEEKQQINNVIDTMRYCRVVMNPGAICKKGKDLKSKVICNLPIGTVVTVVEISGRRCRISSPISGWISLETTDGRRIIQNCNIQSQLMDNAIYALQERENKQINNVIAEKKNEEHTTYDNEKISVTKGNDSHIKSMIYNQLIGIGIGKEKIRMLLEKTNDIDKIFTIISEQLSTKKDNYNKTETLSMSDEWRKQIVNTTNDGENIPKPTTVIEKDDYFKYFIEATSITKDNVEIKLTLNKPVKDSKISYYIYECECNKQQKGEPIAEYVLKNGVSEDFEDLSLDKIHNTKLFNIALYEDKFDKKPISNILKISMPDNDDIDDDYKPDPIDISTVKAIEIDDEKEENIHIYFEIPCRLQGDEIAFKIRYVNNDSKKQEEYISNLLVLPKILIPISFQIITSSTIDDVEYLSNPSKIISVDYKQEMNEKLSDIKTVSLSASESRKQIFEKFLDRHNLSKYENKFEEEECADMEYIEMFDDNYLKNEIGIEKKIIRKKFLKKCIEIKQDMNELKNEYGINELLYERLSKYGLITINIICQQVKKKLDLKNKYEICNDDQCEFIWNLIQEKEHQNYIQIEGDVGTV